MSHGQIVIGSPGSGKTTYCNALQRHCLGMGRKVAVVNLDPANENVPYVAAVDISELIHLQAVMDELKLGPNGGLIYCMDYLSQNMDWLKEKLVPLEEEGFYFIFDLPGQVELFMMHDNLKQIIGTLTDKWHYRLCAVSLVDGHLCTDASKYISMLLLALNTMLHLEMPQINVLSKIDLVKSYGELDFDLSYYAEVQDLSYLVKSMVGGPFSKRFRKLSDGLCSVIEDYGLVKFCPLAVEDKESLAYVLDQCDKANGYVFVSSDVKGSSEFELSSAMRKEDQDLVGKMQERHLKFDQTGQKGTER